jgi:exoribonuclease R
LGEVKVRITIFHKPVQAEYDFVELNLNRTIDGEQVEVSLVEMTRWDAARAAWQQAQSEMISKYWGKVRERKYSEYTDCED